MSEIAAIIDFDLQRAQARFVAAYQRGMKETAVEAQFLAGKGMTNGEIGALVGHSENWTRKIRSWAANGFNGRPFDLNNKPDYRRNNSTDRSSEALKTNEIFKSEDSEIDQLEPDVPEDNGGFMLAVVDNAIKAASTAAKNLSHPLTEEERMAVVAAIDRMIRQWESVKRKLN